MSAKRSPVAFVLVVIVALLLAPGILGQEEKAAEEKKEAEGEAKQEEKEAAKTYTNADLERLFGPSPDEKPAEGEKADADTAANPPDALAAIDDEHARQRTRERQAAEIEKVVAEKKAEVEKLEQRILRIKNPLLPRPEADLTPEEKEQWQGLTAPQRVDLTEKQLEQARKELADAEAKLKKLKSK